MNQIFFMSLVASALVMAPSVGFSGKPMASATTDTTVATELPTTADISIDGNFRSDGLGPIIDGVDNYKSTMPSSWDGFVTSGALDGLRSATLDMSQPVSASSAPYSGTVTANPRLYVRGNLAIPVGTSTTGTALLRVVIPNGSKPAIEWAADFSASSGTSAVQILRESDTQWLVYADSANGDVAKVKKGTAKGALYHIPFAIRFTLK